ncbi:MAG: SurA N-terminal domain-containing protein [Gammaproteobacteria bacterium]|nr:SurA N-terminal domain-containing protein [Gammaproteobacteria bacterium]MBU1723105.1 SurA N-terminal domain-containing protein [Gammaproteobacteria bacterium]MBU2007406.1 SurA N-terminal domain-containing protein [Gammaproteobacteria bacterium]
MLQTIHDKAKGWVAYAIVGLITIPFALFGINSYFEGGGKLVAATVNGEDIPVQAVQNALLEMKQQFGDQLPPGMDDAILKNSALESVINQTLIQQKIREGGYRASDQEVQKTIASIPAFQKDGKFDLDTYNNFLKMQRRETSEFEFQVRDDLSQQQLRSAVLDTAFLPKAEAEQYQSLRNQQRDLELFTLKTADFQSQVQVSDEQVAQYYEQNKASFMTDEKVQLSYLELKRDDLAAGITADDATLQKWFDDNADQYVQPEERMASHILVSVEDPAKDAEAKKRIDALYADLQAGTRTFEDIARTDSDDKLAAEKGGALGAVVMGDWGPEFEKAVIALKAGETSQPVKTEAGYEIIRVTEVKPAVQKTFAEARADIEADYRKEQADKAFLDKAENLGRLVYEQDGDLAPAAQETGLKVQQTDWLSRVQGQGIATDEKVRAAAFDEDVLKSGKNSDLLELADGHAVVVRIANHEAATQKPLDTVKEEIRTGLLTQEARKLTAQKGEELLKKLSETQSWAALAETGLGTETAVEKLGLVGRTVSKLTPEVAAKAFAMNHPAEGKSSWSSAALANGDYAIIVLKAIKAGDTALDESANAIYSQTVGQRELGAMLQGLRESAEVVTHPENL